MINRTDSTNKKAHMHTFSISTKRPLITYWMRKLEILSELTHRENKVYKIQIQLRILPLRRTLSYREENTQRIDETTPIPNTLTKPWRIKPTRQKTQHPSTHKRDARNKPLWVFQLNWRSIEWRLRSYELELVDPLYRNARSHFLMADCLRKPTDPFSEM